MKNALTSLLLLATISLLGQKIPKKEALHIQELQTYSDEIKDKYFPGWGSIPFIILLVDQDKEYLINHPNPTLFSKNNYYDSLFQQSIYYRDRNFSTKMAATFPLVDVNPVIVMGTIDESYFNEARWKWTLLHEHFHQLQMAAKGYGEASLLLDLARDSTDFMWPLDYPFPYDDPTTINKITKMTQILLEEMDNPDKRSLKRYKKAKNGLRKSVSVKDYRYFNFQIWQEGFPRFLEIDMLNQYDPRHLSGIDVPKLTAEYISEVKGILDDPNPSERKRILFYSLGAAEWILINSKGTAWKKSYLQHFFKTDYLLD